MSDAPTIIRQTREVWTTARTERLWASNRDMRTAKPMKMRPSASSGETQSTAMAPPVWPVQPLSSERIPSAIARKQLTRSVRAGQ